MWSTIFVIVFSSISDIVEEEMRLENRTLASQLKTEAQERRSLKKEAALLGGEVRRLGRELDQLREDNMRLERALAEAASQSADQHKKVTELQVQGRTHRAMGVV
jgi:predicted nuclease with TOPRIM domain